MTDLSKSITDRSQELSLLKAQQQSRRSLLKSLAADPTSEESRTTIGRILSAAVEHRGLDPQVAIRYATSGQVDAQIVADNVDLVA